jgi:hypothetical protein
MTVYRRFEKGDIYDSVVVAAPAFELASGSSGWRIQGGVSSSVSIYPGVRSSERRDGISIRPIAESRHPGVDGQYTVTGSYPLSSSLRYVTLRPEVRTAGIQDWGDEHWRSLQLLYAWHARRNPVYNTGSLDFYSLFFRGGSRNIVAASASDSAAWATVTSSFCVEFWVKPFVTSSNTDDYTIASRRGSFYLGITGSDGKLVFSGSSAGIVTSSIGPDPRRWSHVVVRGTNGTGSFKIDLADAGTFSFTALAAPASASYSIGNVFSEPTNGTVEYFSGQVPSGSERRSFFGLIHEGRVWSSYRTDTQLSSSYDRVMHSSASQPTLVSYVRMNQGPLARVSSAIAIGSGVLDHSPRGEHLTLGSFARKGPVWHPCDNPDFKATVAWARQDSSLPHMMVVNVPSLMHGRQIATGSLVMTCRAFSSGTTAIVRTLVDDGYGGLYISGSVSSSSLADKESYKGVDFNRVGNVFYGEGLVVIKDPALLDFGSSQGESVHPNDILQISLKGTSWIPTKAISCRMPAGQYNASQNPTFARLEDDGRSHLVRDEEGPTTYATTVGLYDSKKRLVAVARLVQPLRKRERDKPTVRLRFDF